MRAEKFMSTILPPGQKSAAALNLCSCSKRCFVLVQSAVVVVCTFVIDNCFREVRV